MIKHSARHITELERQRYSVLIVCHLAVLRCIYAYFMDVQVAIDKATHNTCTVLHSNPSMSGLLNMQTSHL